MKNNFKGKFTIIWVESICTIQKLIEENITKNKVDSPDYVGWKSNEAIEDFRKRIYEYEKAYEPLSQENDGGKCCFIKLINENSTIILQNLKGYLESKLLSFLINLHTGERPIYFIRNGESEDSIKNKLGGDTNLSQFGTIFSKLLGTYFVGEVKNYSNIFKEKFVIYCSSLKRSIETADQLKFLGNYKSVKALDELNAGICDGLTYQEFKENYPKEYEERNRDKLRYRYPRGESYMDMILRIEQIIFELEREDGPVIVIAHQGILRCLYGYFALVPIEEIPTLDIPKHTVIKFIPKTYGFDEERIFLDPNNETIKKLDREFVPKYKDNLNHIPEKKMNN